MSKSADAMNRGLMLWLAVVVRCRPATGEQPSTNYQTEHDREQRAFLSTCTQVSDQSQATFSYAVPFDIGLTSLHVGDSITITEIRGTRADFAVGGAYIIKGNYTLASADQADIGFHTTAVQAPGCSRGVKGTRAHQHVTRGSGTFEVSNAIPYVGYPHLSFYIDGKGTSDVYFGKGDFLQR